LVEVKQLNIDGFIVFGVRVDVGKTSILFVFHEDSAIVSDGVNILALNEASEKVAQVEGASTFEKLLRGKVVAATKKATESGVKLNMSGEEALRVLANQYA